MIKVFVQGLASSRRKCPDVPFQVLRQGCPVWLGWLTSASLEHP
jgi:hypothetical protein